MPNLHPVLTTFPLSLICVVVVFEAYAIARKSASFNSAINLTLGLALVLAVAAFFSGYYARELAGELSPVLSNHVATHHQFGRLMLFAIFPCVALRFISEKAKYYKRGFRITYLVALMITLALVIYTGYLGGVLVFKQGVGVILPRP